MLYLQDVRSAIERKDWSTAEPLLRRGLTDSPESAEIHYLHGLACFKLEMLVEAEKSLLVAYRLTPENAPTLFYLASCAILQGETHQAVTWLEKYLALMPGDIEGWKHLGMVLTERKTHEQALAAFGRALELAPESSELRWLVGYAHHQLGQNAEAARMLATVDPLAPQAGRAFKLAMLSAEKAKIWDVAIAIARQSLAQSPESSEVLRQLARFQFLADQGEDYRVTHRQSRIVGGLDPDSTRLICARVVTTETWELLAGKWVQLHLKPEAAGPLARIRPSLTRHDNVTLLAPEWLVLTARNDVLIEQMVHNPLTLHTKGTHVLALDENRCLLDLPEDPISIDDACILVGGGPHYYHWLIDHLPRIGIAHKVPALRDIKLIVSDDLADWQLASLATLGIGTDRLYPLPANAIAHCRALWVPTLLARTTITHSYVAGWLRQRFLTREMKARTPRRLFIRHLPGESSTLVNEDEITACLIDNGFEIIATWTMSFMDLVTAFASAEIVVSTTSPPLTNLVFAPLNALIVEIKSPGNPATFFKTLTQSIQRRYLRIEARTQPMGEVDSFYLDPADLLDAIAIAEKTNR